MAERLPRPPAVWPGRPESPGGCPETTITSYQTGLPGRGSWPRCAYASFCLYLGFLNARDMACDGPLFRSEAEWTCVLKGHSSGTVAEACWGEWLDIAGVPMIPLVRAIDQPFDPDIGEARL